MTEQTRNQHKNSMKNRPSGQSSLLQYTGKTMAEISPDITQEEYEN